MTALAMTSGLLATVVPAAAQAAETGSPTTTTEEERPARTLLFEGAAGIGAPLGWLGASAVVVPIEALALHGGVGLGSQGIQIDAGLRARFARGPRDHFAVGAGWSSGSVAVVGSDFLPGFGMKHYPVWYWNRAHLVNIDVSFEHDLGGSVVARPFVGIGYVVNRGDALLVNAPCPGCKPGVLANTIPYFGVAFAFGVL